MFETLWWIKLIPTTSVAEIPSCISFVFCSNVHSFGQQNSLSHTLTISKIEIAEEATSTGKSSIDAHKDLADMVWLGTLETKEEHLSFSKASTDVQNKTGVVISSDT